MEKLYTFQPLKQRENCCFASPEASRLIFAQSILFTLLHTYIHKVLNNSHIFGRNYTFLLTYVTNCTSYTVQILILYFINYVTRKRGIIILYSIPTGAIGESPLPPFLSSVSPRPSTARGRGRGRRSRQCRRGSPKWCTSKPPSLSWKRSMKLALQLRLRIPKYVFEQHFSKVSLERFDPAPEIPYLESPK